MMVHVRVTGSLGVTFLKVVVGSLHAHRPHSVHSGHHRVTPGSQMTPLSSFPLLRSVRRQNQDPPGNAHLPEEAWISRRLWNLHGQLEVMTRTGREERQRLYLEVCACVNKLARPLTWSCLH